MVTDHACMILKTTAALSTRRITRPISIAYTSGCGYLRAEVGGGQAGRVNEVM